MKNTRWKNTVSVINSEGTSKKIKPNTKQKLKTLLEAAKKAT